jgi:hypothetical protein
MKHMKIYIPYPKITERLVPLVREKVLHITCSAHLPSILAAGGVSGNADGRFRSSFGSSANGFCRTRNLVSVFDYRSVPDDEFERLWSWCGPYTALLRCQSRIALLFIKELNCDSLVSWKAWESEQAWEQMMVPYVEAGYPAPLPLEAIEEIVEVRTRRPVSSLERALQKSWRQPQAKRR